MKPENPLDVYRGEVLYEAICADFFWKLIPGAVWMEKNPEREAKYENIGKEYEKAAAHLARTLSQKDHKFICGDKLTTHDFTVGGLWLNLFTNPNSKDPEFWAKLYEASPDRVKKYVTDLKEELKDYLAARP